MKLVLICYAGMSTSMVLNRMRSSAADRGIEVELAAVSLTELKEYTEGASAILLGPQIRYAVDDVRRQVQDQVPVLAIDTRDYGRMRGDKILDSAIKAIEEFKKQQDA